jgi:hypothetical protein
MTPPEGTRRLQRGESARSRPIHAREKENPTGIHLEHGARYRIQVVEVEDWRD